MRCQSCGAENPQEARFCAECGASLEITCPGCGARCPPQSKFCPQCGQPLLTAEAPTEEFLGLEPSQLEKLRRYMPQYLIDKILASRGEVEGERKQVTVLFVDIKGSTDLQVKLGLEQERAIADRWYELFIHETYRNEGYVQFLGDGAMAMFGAPVAHEDAPRRAIRTALAFRDKLQQLSKKLQQEGITFEMRMGINTGEVILGTIGNDLRVDYTATGLTVTLARRMEETARPNTIQISENTYRLVGGFFELKPREPIEIQGLAEKVETYEVLGLSELKTPIQVSEDRGLTKLIGREKELELLNEALSRARKAQGQVVCVSGDPGVGKSRLILEFKRSLPQDVLYLEGQCLSYDRVTPYLPFLEILRGYFGIAGEDAREKMRTKLMTKVAALDPSLEDSLPHFYDLFSISKELENLDKEVQRNLTFRAIHHLLHCQSVRQPLVLIVEDLHWIDPTSEELLEHLIDGIGASSILILATYRPAEYAPSWQAKSYEHRLTLSPLGNEEARRLVEVLLGVGKLTKPLAQLALKKSEGNPFFAEEITKSLIDGGVLVKSEKGYVVTRGVAEIEVPSTLKDAIMARIDRLSPELKETVQLAAVIGREFSLKLLREVADGEETREQLRRLQSLEMIYEKSLFPEKRYIFKHALTQNVAYHSLLEEKRSQHHRRIAGAIEALYPEKLEEHYGALAYHYRQGAEEEKSLRYLRLAGERAFELFANEEAAEHLRTALGILEELPQTEKVQQQRIEFGLKLNDALFRTGPYDERYLKNLQEVERLAQELGDKRSLAKALGEIAGFYTYVQQEPRLARKYGGKSLELAEEIDDPVLKIGANYGAAVFYLESGNLQRATETYRHILQMCEGLGVSSLPRLPRVGNIYSATCTALGAFIYGMFGDWSQAFAYLRQGMDKAQELDDRLAIAFNHFHAGATHMYKGDWQPAVEHGQQALEIYEQTGIREWIALCFVGIGYADCFAGNQERGMGYLHQAIETFENLHPTPSFALLFLAEVYLEQGSVEEARREAGEAIDFYLKSEDVTLRAYANALRAGILSGGRSPDWEAVENHYRQAIASYEKLGAKPYLARCYRLLGEMQRAKGDLDRARKYLSQAISMFEEMEMAWFLERAKTALREIHKGA